MGCIIPLPPEAIAAMRLRLEQERAHLKRFLFTIEAVLEEHELFDVEPWLCGLKEQIAEYDARIARYAAA
ncbi:MAG TPA: hypothetical protein VHM01_00730 [Alphaproteobacteria bacterium]|nr:hypothetical protein [Alphaproteobacteria bacterium]